MSTKPKMESPRGFTAFLSRTNLILAATVLTVLFVAIVAWGLYPVTIEAKGNGNATFTVDCEYDRFRQIMVRKNATAAIIAGGNMKLLEERLGDLKLDTSADDRPVLNAVLGKSRTEVDSVKTLLVQLNDPQVNAERLKLKQEARIRNDQMQVTTTSVGEAGNLKAYQTQLQAQPEQQSTKVTLSNYLTISVQVPRWFKGKAAYQVQRAAAQGLDEQQKSIVALIEEFADDRLVLPQF